MLFRDALDIILRELPPKKVDLERPQESALLLLFKGVHQHSANGGTTMPLLILLIGVVILFQGIIGGLEVAIGTVPLTWGIVFSLVVGAVLCWKSIQVLIGVGNTTFGGKRWLELSLTEEGGNLYEGKTGQTSQLLAHFGWRELTDIRIERQKRLHEDAHPYCIHLRSSQYEDLYLFEWEALGKEVGYCANVLAALWELQNTGNFPKDWNKDNNEEPPFMDLSSHLIDD